MKKVLIIEDDPDAVTYYTTVLEDLEVECISAGDGVAGLEMFKTQRPDLVLLDLMMPKKGGVKVFDEVKETPELRQIPIIIISGASQATGVDLKRYFRSRRSPQYQTEAAEEDTDQWPNKYMEKPVDPDELAGTVKEILGLE
jgi:CheY-like chemotaxis protein